MQRCPAAQERLRRAKGTRFGDDRQILPTLHRPQRHPWLDLADQADAHCAGGIEQSARCEVEDPGVFAQNNNGVKACSGAGYAAIRSTGQIVGDDDDGGRHK